MNENRRSEAPEINKREVLEIAFIRGENTESNPCRYVRRYTNLDGEILAEHDPFLDKDMHQVILEDKY
ncbi:hypothetical protein JTZ62_05035 [Mammaliicoccus sciuri]|uniref:hypothetical protein n=1 Tax=Mammaliicoccus sciuri TaxID=1296 RepID=UPI0019D32763|nr:hypothetical protein [Mammaliicoccus sciuri]QSN68524.1 hypothetical protein JTZ62_05035 [Mammaliicoccus sciuri]UIU23266.1 hypothetical protein LLZ87_05050 [Mammaliicoccus sciuri]UIU26172.1 hypothetical protein LLZ92_05050 [Mammaliicoccus sciuri]